MLLRLFVLAVIMLPVLATMAGAQTPTFLLKWDGDGTTDGNFWFPEDLIVDGSGDVYVVDRGQNRIQKFDADGNFLFRWGSRGDLPGEFESPYGIAVDDSGYVYVADASNHRVQKFNSNGGFISSLGLPGSLNGQFNWPLDVAVDGDDNIYVTDSLDRVQKFDEDGAFLLSWGSTGSGEGEFKTPRAIVTDSNGMVYVADHINSRVQKFDSNGVFLTSWPSLNPYGIATDGNGHVFTASYHQINHKIMMYDSNGNFLLSWGSLAGNQFQWPFGVATAANGIVYASCNITQDVQKFQISFVTGVDELPVAAVSSFSAYPNPFNPRVSLSYHIATDELVRISVVDLSGRVLRVLDQGMRSRGRHDLTWDGIDDQGRAVASGVYLMKMKAGGERLTRKVSLVR